MALNGFELATCRVVNPGSKLLVRIGDVTTSPRLLIVGDTLRFKIEFICFPTLLCDRTLPLQIIFETRYGIRIAKHLCQDNEEFKVGFSQTGTQVIEHGHDCPLQVRTGFRDDGFELSDDGSEVGPVEHCEHALEKQDARDDVPVCLFADGPSHVDVFAGSRLAIGHEQDAGHVTVRAGEVESLFKEPV